MSRPDPPRRRAGDRDPGLARARLAQQYDGPWARAARLARLLSGKWEPGPLGRWLAQRDEAWITRYAERGTDPPDRYRVSPRP